LVLLLVAFFAVLAVWLVASNSGLRFVVARALPADGSVRIAELQGSVWSGVVARGVQVVLPDTRIEAREARADPALVSLWVGALRLRSVQVAGLRIERAATPTAQARSAAAPDLPDLRIEALRIDAVEFVQDETRWLADRIEARVAMRASAVAIDALRVAAPEGRIDGILALDMRRDLPVQSARLAFDLVRDGERYAGGLEARTERGRTSLTLAVQAPLLAVVALSDVSDIDTWQAHVEVPRQVLADTPLSASLRLQTRAGDLRVQGEAAFGALDIANISGAAQIGDMAIDIAPSTLDFTLPQGRVAVQGRIPFDAAAPLALELRSEELAFTAVAEAPLTVSGAISLSGPRDALVLAPDLRLQRDGWPTAQASGRIVQDGATWRAEALQLRSGRSVLAIDGTLATSAEAAPLQLRLQQFDPALLAPDWSGNLDAELTWTGRFADTGLDGELHIERLQGEMRGRGVRGRGVVSLVAGVLDHADAVLSSGASTLRLQRDDADAPLQVELDAPDLADLWPDWQGRVLASARIDRELALQASLDAVATPEFALAQAQLQARAGSAADAPVTIQGRLRDLAIGDLRFERVQLGADGTRANHRIDLELQSGLRQLQLAATGALSPQRVWRGRLVELDLLAPELRASLGEAASLSWHDGRLGLARTCLAGAAGGRLCLQVDHDDVRTEVGAEAVALDLGPLSELLAPQAPFTTAARLSGSTDLILVDGRLHSLSARIDSAEGSLRVDDRPDLDLGWRDFALDLSTEGDTGRWTAAATLRPEGRVESQGSLSHVDGDWQYEGTLGLKVHRFDAVEAFTSQFASPRGDLSGDMQFRGRGLERPQWSGAFAITGFAAELPELGLELGNGALAIVAVPTGIIVRGAITSGGGQLILDGSRGAEARAPWQFALNGDQAVLSDTPALRLVLSPSLTLNQREGAWQLAGRVDIAEARIDAEALAPPIDVSSDVVIVDAEADAAADALDWAADITLAFGEQAKLVGYGFDGRIRGDLRLRQRSGGHAYGQGQLQVSGRYAAYGQRLTIRRGRILFANSPLDEPTLDIEAERKAGSAVAGVRVTGTARRPQTEIYARPAMPESEALALLVTGRNLRGVSGADRQRLSNAALALGTIGGDLLASNLGAEIGITGDAARGTEAFTIGKYLTPRLFVGYGIGLARNGSVLIVRYLIRDDIELEATSGEQSRASLNYIIEK
jgi:translocation and assembly module TamB